MDLEECRITFGETGLMLVGSIIMDGTLTPASEIMELVMDIKM